MTLEHVAVVKIFSCAKIVNMPAEILRNETNDRMFMAPYIIANTAILDDRLIRYFNFAPPFSPTLRSDVILYAEYIILMISPTRSTSYCSSAMVCLCFLNDEFQMRRR